MRKKTILICDDEKLQREYLKRTLENDYNVIEVDNYLYLTKKVEESEHIHLVILDLRFNDDWVGHTVLPDLYEKFPKLKVLICSTLFDNLDGKGSKEELLKILSELNNSQVAGYASPNDAEERLVAQVNNITGTSKWLKSNQVWFLHISDPQFGGSGLAYDTEKLSNRVWDCIRDYGRNKNNLPPDDEKYFDFPEFVVITGDIAERARPEDYEKATDFITKLSKSIGLENPNSKALIGQNNIIILPGNHDINWDISFARSIIKLENEPLKFDKDKLNDLEYLREYSWLPYEKFANSFEQGSWHFQAGFKVIDLSKELHLIFVCLNSSLWDVNHVSQKPEIPQTVFNEIRSELNDKYDSENTATRILLVHHTLNQDAGIENQLKIKETTEREQLINTLSRECGFSLVFTGHIHKRAVSMVETGNDNRTLHHIGAGTLRSNDTAEFDRPQFNLIRLYELSPESNKFEKVAVYTFAYDGTNYLINPINNDGTKDFRVIDIKYI